MKLIQCRYSSGQRIPLLVQTGDAAPLPILVPFSAAGLHERVAKALAAIDPNVVEAERRVKRVADVLRDCTEAVTNAEAELRACQHGIIELESQQAYLTTDMVEISSNNLLGGD